MSWVDRVIGIIVVIEAILGRSRGALVQIGGLAGAIGGFLAGTLLAPPVTSIVTDARWRAAVALVVVVACTVAGTYLGRVCGTFLRQTLKYLKVGVVDSIAGIVVGVVETLVVCWLFAAMLNSVAWTGLDRGIQGSQIIRAMDRVMPTPSVFLARVQSLFRYGNFPAVFAGVTAPNVARLPSRVSLKQLERVTRSLGSPNDVVKVIADGRCARGYQGTAFLVSSNEAVTNAHVVAGASRVMVGGVPATVALFDPLNDIAVLRMPSMPAGVSGVGERFLTGVPLSGLSAEVIGFPENATRTGAPAYLSGELTALGRDIYNTRSFNRRVLALYAQVQPGSSGSPVFVGPYVAGVIFSKSYGQNLTAYAVPASIVQRDVAKTPARGSVSTQGCVN